MQGRGIQSSLAHFPLAKVDRLCSMLHTFSDIFKTKSILSHTRSYLFYIFSGFYIQNGKIDRINSLVFAISSVIQIFYLSRSLRPNQAQWLFEHSAVLRLIFLKGRSQANCSSYAEKYQYLLIFYLAFGEFPRYNSIT